MPLEKSLPVTDTTVIISAEPNTFSPRHVYFPSSDLEAFKIRKLPSGRTAILEKESHFIHLESPRFNTI